MKHRHINNVIPLVEIEIESGIPLPPVVHPRKLQWTDFFSEMKVGDSFFVDNIATNIMSSHMSRAKKALKRKFTQRTVGKGVRVWRVS